ASPVYRVSAREVEVRAWPRCGAPEPCGCCGLGCGGPAVKRLALTLALLVPFGAFAQDAHSLTVDGKCPPAFTSQIGVTDGKVWTVRYCRWPAAERDKHVY